jgi:hypothetical protein
MYFTHALIGLDVSETGGGDRHRVQLRRIKPGQGLIEAMRAGNGMQ